MPHQRIAPIGDYTPFPVIAAQATVTAVGALVNTTSATTITAGLAVVVTPTSMANITPMMWLNIANGTGNAEDVQVIYVNYTTGTFTANFVYGHSGAYTIISRKGTYLGSIVVNNPGSSNVITLYNGHPSTLPVAGIAFATVAASAGYLTYNCWCNRGLFFTASGGTFGNYTIMYADSQV